jgi:hypothetical protein
MIVNIQLPHVFQNLHGGGGGGASVLRLMLCAAIWFTPAGQPVSLAKTNESGIV